MQRVLKAPQNPYLPRLYQVGVLRRRGPRIEAFWPQPHSRPRRPSPARDKFLKLVAKGNVTAACAMPILGVSRQRIHQLERRTGQKLMRLNQPNTLISWPCPTCGSTVQMWTVQRNQRKSAFCRKCVQRETHRALRKEIKPLVCMDCGKERIYKGRRNALRAMKNPPKRCASCNMRRVARNRKKVLCKRGHVLAETRDKAGNCKLCDRERYHERKARAS